MPRCDARDASTNRIGVPASQAVAASIRRRLRFASGAFDMDTREFWGRITFNELRTVSAL
jgi:hypothetical protein